MSTSQENDRAADMQLMALPVFDTAGRQARLVSIRQTGAQREAVLVLEDGTNLAVPVSLLARQSDDKLELPFAFGAVPANADGRQEIGIPVLQETVNIDKHAVDTGKGIRVSKTVSERMQLVDPPLLQDELVIEHVPVGQPVAAGRLPATRYEGDTLIVPILEEVLVVEKQVRLKEELRITRQRREVHAPQTVTLKSEQVTVERFDESGDPSPPDILPNSASRLQPDPGKPAV